MKKKLSFKPEYNFTLIGISSRENDYKLSWALNKNLSFNFKRDKKGYILNTPKKQTEQLSLFDYVKDDENNDVDTNIQLFSMYNYECENEALSYLLVSNKGEKGPLIPEQKGFEYLMLIDGEINNIGEFIKKINDVEEVLLAKEIDVDKLKKTNKQKLIIK